MGGRDPKPRVFHGPNTANFKRDYDTLNALGIALQIMNASDLVASIDIDSPRIGRKAAEFGS